MAHIIEIDEFSQLLGQTQGGNRPVPGPRQIHKVHQEIRSLKEHLYEPKMISLGPYHHGKEELKWAEGFKNICLDWCSRNVAETKLELYNKILARIGEIRSCYAEVEIVEQYDNKALAMMMLLDSCFIINFMENNFTEGDGNNNNLADWLGFFGLALCVSFADMDILLLENQVPYLVINLLMSSLFVDAAYRKRLLERFIYRTTSVSRRDEPFVIPGEDTEPPIHLLEACWRVFQMQQNEQNITPANLQLKPLTNPNNIFYKNRSATEFKAMRIVCCPSSSLSLKHITFDSYTASGILHLPAIGISQPTPVLFSNLIAYEVSPSTKTEPVVLSYMILMKSLIQSPEDVKQLQQNGILMNRFGNNEQVVQAFREINTFGLLTVDSFEDVKLAIEKHCGHNQTTLFSFLLAMSVTQPQIFKMMITITMLYLALLQTIYSSAPKK